MISKLFISIFALILSTAATAQTGREIMERQDEIHGVQVEYTDSTMTLHNAKGRTKLRRMLNYSIRTEEDQYQSLIKFVEPANVNNVGLLTWTQTAPKEDDQWLYLPASKKIKRITGGSKSNAFMGTDFAYEDMGSENLTAHKYNLIGEETVDGHDCWIVEALPGNEQQKKNSGYSKRVFWIRKDIYFTVKADFYDRRSNLKKIATYSDVAEIGGGAWRGNNVLMKDLKRKTMTELVVDKRDVQTPISASLFDPQSLKRPVSVR